MPEPAIRKKTELRQHQKGLRNLFAERRIMFLLQDWDDGYNVGGMFRVAVACGAEELLLVGRTPAPPHPMIGVTSLGMHRRVAFETFPKWGEALDHARQKGYCPVAVELTPDAVPYREFAYPERVCLVLGNEGAGVSAKLLAACEASVMIPMKGKGRSLNVHVAAAIVGFEAALRT